MVGVTRKRLAARPYRERLVTVNGQPGQVLIAPDGCVSSVLTIDVADGAIQAVRIIRNPDKLAHVQADDVLLAGRRRGDPPTPRPRRRPATPAPTQGS